MAFGDIREPHILEAPRLLLAATVLSMHPSLDRCSIAFRLCGWPFKIRLGVNVPEYRRFGTQMYSYPMAACVIGKLMHTFHSMLILMGF